MLLLSGCTCIDYKEEIEFPDELPRKILIKQMNYCSSKDMVGLHITHGNTVITLDRANNDFDKVITDIAKKVPVSPL